jgi:hypothetical protein
MKRKILDGVSSFLEVGAILPEFEDKAIQNPKSLLTPQPKLLTVVASESAHEEDGPSLNDIQTAEDVLRKMSPEEREAWFKGLDRKSRGAGGEQQKE